MKSWAVRNLATLLARSSRISAIILHSLPTKTWGSSPLRGQGLWKLMVRHARLPVDVRRVKTFKIAANKTFKMDLCLNEYTSLGYYFETEADSLMRIIQAARGGLFVDVGTNIGFYSLAASLYFDEVWSFEPDPENVKQLQQNIAISGIKNIVLKPMGLGKSSDSLKLWRNPQNKGGNSLLDPGVADMDSVIVPVERFDAVLPQEKWAAISLIKVDVEGFEENVLAGMQGFFSQNFRPDIFIESPSAQRFEEIKRHIPIDYFAYDPQSKHPIDAKNWHYNDVLFSTRLSNVRV